MLLIWRFRVFSNAAVGLRLLNDYRNAEFVMMAPRINPNYDSSPAMSAFDKRFGEVVEASVSVGGMEFVWQQSENEENMGKLFSPERKNQKSEFVGQLLDLSKKNG